MIGSEGIPGHKQREAGGLLPCGDETGRIASCSPGPSCFPAPLQCCEVLFMSPPFFAFVAFCVERHPGVLHLRLKWAGRVRGRELQVSPPPLHSNKRRASTKCLVELLSCAVDTEKLDSAANLFIRFTAVHSSLEPLEYLRSQRVCLANTNKYWNLEQPDVYYTNMAADRLRSEFPPPGVVLQPKSVRFDLSSTAHFFPCVSQR